MKLLKILSLAFLSMFSLNCVAGNFVDYTPDANSMDVSINLHYQNHDGSYVYARLDDGALFLLVNDVDTTLGQRSCIVKVTSSNKVFLTQIASALTGYNGYDQVGLSFTIKDGNCSKLALSNWVN